MKQFTCDCIRQQFKKPEEVYIGFSEQSCAEILCAYRPNQKVTLRRVRLEARYCPYCGKEMREM